MWWSDVARPLVRPFDRRTALLASAAALLSGCGFELRRPPPLAFTSIALAGFAQRSPLAAELKEVLSRSVRVLEAPAQADVVLHAIADARERSVVAQTSAAQVRELQLRVKFNFKASTAAGRELLPLSTLLLARDMSFNESAALAKEQEQAELYREMQADVVLQVMRRLAAIKL
jgi:LPS-assembly lipoprotein